ncbi:tannase/feruloyl esterase family alpha/beta hydrolase [Sphingopyxis granuli]|uniref:tannase/feruloyl esterase family alpha/beta hydrolase n=1 Tax=Sphingopyxis granuli TaxID=267128 RepID=UPI00301E59B5
MRTVSARTKLALCLASTILAAAPAVAKEAARVPAGGLACDDSLKAAFQPADDTQVLQVQQVRKGDAFPNPTMDQLVYPEVPTSFGADMCWVKLLVGPGSAGPADAPSTSKGIGIEVWLPAKAAWNGRFHAIGGSGSTGSEEAVLGKISSWTGGIDTRSAPRVAAEEGAVTSTTDSGKGADREFSFMMLPDGSLNKAGLRDWNERALLEQAVKTKALITAYYGKPARHSYFDGASGGGRQAFHILQNVPGQYDGIIAGVAALNWVEMLANQWPGIVIMNDLGGKAPSAGQVDLVVNKAIAACDVVDGRHLGFVIDNKACRYDPTKDKSVLCATDGGSNETADCVSLVIARALNKMWYGPTRDGSVPDPAVDNGWLAHPSGNRLWYGQPRGTDLKGWARISGMLGADNYAVLAGDPTIATAGFKNALGSGQDKWKTWSYAEYAAAWDGLQKVRAEWDMSATDPDITAFQKTGAKFINLTHVNDLPLLSQGALDYYDKVAAKMGGTAELRKFYRMFVAPGLAHGPDNGTPNPAANPPAPARGQMYNLLVDWVEKGEEPRNLIFTTATKEVSAMDAFAGAERPQVSLPVCEYPTHLSFVGGDIFQAASYTCK